VPNSDSATVVSRSTPASPVVWSARSWKIQRSESPRGGVASAPSGPVRTIALA